MRVKRVVGLVGALIVVCGMVACAGGGSDKNAAIEPEAVSTSVNMSGEEEASSDIEQAAPHILVDENGVKMTLESVDPDGEWGYTWNVKIENNTDVPLMFATENASVDGYMADPVWADSIDAGKKAIDEIYWDDEDLEKCGIDKYDIKNVEMTLHAYDENDYTSYYEGAVSVDF